jgi:hypothetical protein
MRRKREKIESSDGGELFKMEKYKMEVSFELDMFTILFSATAARFTIIVNGLSSL